MKPLCSLQLAAAAVLGLAMSGVSAAEPSVSIYNWYDYIAPDATKNFQRETGVATVYDVFDNGDVMQSKLMAGRSGYDVVVASSELLPNLIKAGVLQEPSCRTCPTWTRRSSPRSSTMIRATVTPRPTCGAPPGLATMRTRSRRCWAPRPRWIPGT